MIENNREKVLQLAKNISVDLLEERKSTRDILVTCKTICKILDISEENGWIDLELNGYLVRYKTGDDLKQNLPPYRRTNWDFYDLYGNRVTLPPDIIDLFGKSIIFQSIQEIENKENLSIGNQFLDKFNNFINEHGIDYASKNIRIHEARISKTEITCVIEGVRARIQNFLDMIISLLEPNLSK